MLLRVGGLFVVTGLTLALALGPMLAVVGGVLMVWRRDHAGARHGVRARAGEPGP